MPAGHRARQDHRSPAPPTGDEDATTQMRRARSALLRPRCSADTRLCARRAALPRPSCGDRRRCLLRNTCRFHRPACPQHRNPRRPTSRGRNSRWSRARRVLRRLDQPARSPGLRHKPIDRHNCTQTTDQPPTKVVGNVGSAAESEPAGGRVDPLGHEVLCAGARVQRLWAMEFSQCAIIVSKGRSS
jgi:hypothetical protein